MTNNNDELMHYGVIGMKWGVHRARKLQAKADRKKRKGDMEGYKKYSAKSAKITNMHKRRAGAAYDRINNQKMSKTLLQDTVFGSYGALKYNQMRAKNVSRGEAAVKSRLYNVGNIYSGNLLSVIEPRWSSGELDKYKKKAQSYLNG